jgi:hypothetical protein
MPSLGTFHNAKHADQARRLQKCLAVLYSRMKRNLARVSFLSFLFLLFFFKKKKEVKKMLSFDVTFLWELYLKTNKE